jgi:MinD-like ATPase involved in chromosome partitioning or flagellar assembly
VAAAAPVADEYPLNLDAAPCIFVWAAKGGVNKTSTALQLAHRAAEAGYRVWLVDMNRGQGGIRSALRVPDLAPIRSALDAARVGDPAQAFVKPAELQQHRAASLDPIKFGVVLAPPRAEADPSQVPYTAYRQIIEHARAHGDLVIVDTQTVEAIDISGLIDNVMVPAMIVNAHGVAVTEPGKESVDNIHAALSRYRLRGLTSDRQLLVVSRTNKFTDADAQAVAGKFAGLAHFVGSTAYSDEVKNQLDSGRVTSDEPAVRPLLNAVLRQVTGDKERFADAGRRPGKSPRGRRK